MSSIFVRNLFDLNQEHICIFATMIIYFCEKFTIDLVGSNSRHSARGCVNTCSSSLVLKLTLFVFNHFFFKWLTKKEMYSLFLCLRKHTWQWDHFDWHGVADDRSWSPFDWTNSKSDSDFDWFEALGILMQNCLVVGIFSEVETAFKIPSSNPEV